MLQRIVSQMPARYYMARLTGLTGVLDLEAARSQGSNGQSCRAMYGLDERDHDGFRVDDVEEISSV